MPPPCRLPAIFFRIPGISRIDLDERENPILCHDFLVGILMYNGGINIQLAIYNWYWYINYIYIYIHPSLNVSKYWYISIIDVYSCILAIQVSMDLGWWRQRPSRPARFGGPTRCLAHCWPGRPGTRSSKGAKFRHPKKNGCGIGVQHWDDVSN